MRILAIETSCDETAVSILEIEGEVHDARFRVLGNALYSQAHLHAEYGGVYPNLAKREHAKNLVPLLRTALAEADILNEGRVVVGDKLIEKLKKMLQREPELFFRLGEFLTSVKKPDIDAIAVTHGPGLEPALWVGVNFARALSEAWKIPILPTNHMEGHIVSSLVEQNEEDKKHFTMRDVEFPVLALLISGGHTEFVKMDSWHEYKVIGGTRDDAIGEAFDKVARMLDLPYPGGVHISRLAAHARRSDYRKDPRAIKVSLPRPMINSDDLDFSFSGLKTAALYLVRSIEEGKMDETLKRRIAKEFDDAVSDVLVAKTRKALNQTSAKTLLIGGGVANNEHIRRSLAALIADEFPETILFLPAPELTTDNAIMIGMAAFLRALRDDGEVSDIELLRAQGNLAF